MSVARFPEVPLVTKWALSKGFGGADRPSGHMDAFPAEVGCANGAFYPLRPGSFLLDLESRFHVPVTVDAQVLFNEPILALRLPSSGHAVVRSDAHRPLEESAEAWNMALVTGGSCMIDHVPGDAYRCMVAVFTTSRLEALLDGQRCPDLVRRFLSGQVGDFGAVARTSSKLRRIANEIRQNPYEGAMASLHREGKTYEFLAEAFTILGVQDERGARINVKDRNSAMGAYDILMANLTCPPPIEDVARQVGLSQRRLTEVFRELFGAPPFQCLTKWRLDAAQVLLDQGQLSVKQVSYSMGYAHVSSFTQAFVRQFGYPPRNRLCAGVENSAT